MKKIFILVLLSISCIAYADSSLIRVIKRSSNKQLASGKWEFMGKQNFVTPSRSTIPQMIFDSKTNKPYIAYLTPDNYLKVMTYDGKNWIMMPEVESFNKIEDNYFKLIHDYSGLEEAKIFIMYKTKNPNSGPDILHVKAIDNTDTPWAEVFKIETWDNFFYFNKCKYRYSSHAQCNLLYITAGKLRFLSDAVGCDNFKEYTPDALPIPENAYNKILVQGNDEERTTTLGYIDSNNKLNLLKWQTQYNGGKTVTGHWVGQTYESIITTNIALTTTNVVYTDGKYPCVAYSDFKNKGRISVAYVGIPDEYGLEYLTENISESGATSLSLSYAGIDSIGLSYVDYAHNDKVSTQICKLGPTTPLVNKCSYVGKAGFTPTSADFTQVVLDNSAKAIVLYRDANSGALSVMTYR